MPLSALVILSYLPDQRLNVPELCECGVIVGEASCGALAAFCELQSNSYGYAQRVGASSPGLLAVCGRRRVEGGAYRFRAIRWKDNAFLSAPSLN